MLYRIGSAVNKCFHSYYTDLASLTGVDAVMKATRTIATDSTEHRVTVELCVQTTHHSLILSPTSSETQDHTAHLYLVIMWAG